jgi:hypothetical protein
MSKEQEREALTDEELEAQHSEEIPERAAMSVLGLPVADTPIDPPEPPSADV